ncbi:hypothetical protein CVT25_009389 [Psilocybe cyanescens]|uniref:Uncharacterized protein n=1 Tax=Psilocybe cyanescens TaxID=93625 RepID=A0A409XV97_PSICY|nr:hypothetical protein CVT25_009389 [Psilocybe cyanescens]
MQKAYMTSVGMSVLPNAPLNTMFGGKKGFALVEITAKHPLMRMQLNYKEQLNANGKLERTVAELISCNATLELLQEPDENSKGKRPKKKKGKATARDLLISTLGNSSGNSLGTPAGADMNYSELLVQFQQMSKDTADLKQTVANLNQTVTNLNQTVANLNQTVANLEQTVAAEQEDQEEHTKDIEEWIGVQDPLFLQRIRLRALLDKGQAKLAQLAGLISPDNSLAPSAKWGAGLNGNVGQRQSDEDRLITARNLLTSQGHSPGPLQMLMSNANAMRLLTERESSIRKKGNFVAHQLGNLTLFKDIIEQAVKSAQDKDGMLAILAFVTSS